MPLELFSSSIPAASKNLTLLSSAVFPDLAAFTALATPSSPNALKTALWYSEAFLTPD